CDPLLWKIQGLGVELAAVQPGDGPTAHTAAVMASTVSAAGTAKSGSLDARGPAYRRPVGPVKVLTWTLTSTTSRPIICSTASMTWRRIGWASCVTGRRTRR